MLRITSFTGSLALIGALTVQTASAALIQVIGPSARTLDLAESAQSLPLELRFPVTVEPLGKNATVQTELVSLSLGDRVLAIDSAKLAYTKDADRDNRALLELEIPAADLLTAGTYTVTIEFWKRTVPEPDDDIEKGPQVSDEGSLTLTLTRPAGTLTLDPPLKVERVMHLPFGEWSTFQPDAFTLTETSGRNRVGLITPNTDSEAIVDLRPGSNSATVARLRAALPSGVDAGQQVNAPITLVGRTPFSTVSGTLRIISEQLEPRLLTANVELTTRLSRFWLLTIIVVGVVIGHFVRDHLEKKKGIKRARAKALRVKHDVEQAHASTVDEDFRRRIAEEALAALKTAMASKSATVESLTTAAETARTALTAILEDLENTRAELDEALSGHLAALAIAEGTPRSELLDGLADSLRGAKSSVSDGDLTAAAEPIDSIRKELLDVVEALKKEKQLLLDPMSKLQKWDEVDPQLPESATGAKVRESINGFALPALPNTVTATESASVAEAVRGLGLLSETVAGRLKIRANRIGEYARELCEKLSSLANVDFSKLDQAVSAFEAARKSVIEDSTGEPAKLEALFDAERKLHGEFEDVLTYAAKTSTPPIPKPGGLTDGRFRQAVNAISVHRGPGPLVLASPPDVKRALDSIQEPTYPPASGWSIRILRPVTAELGSSVDLRADIVTASGTHAPVIRSVNWSINKRPVPASADSMSCRYEPAPSEAKLDVQVVVIAEDPSGMARATGAATIILSTNSDLDRAEDLELQASAVAGIQTFLAGVLIVAAGYAIFHDSFVGNLGNVVTALFWGFGIDLTVAKALEYSTPLTGKALPQQT